MNGFLLDSPPLDVFGQMALDEALAQSRPDAFCIRFFRWAGPAATFGYAQRIAEVENLLPAGIGQNFTRRPTGGGIVPHLDDLTFSCVFPAEGMLRPADIYRRLHPSILAGLRGLGLDATLYGRDGRAAPRGRTGGASQCFVEPVALDILTAEGKVLGGAIRRFGNTVLYQGSLQISGSRKPAGVFEAAIRESLAAEWDLVWKRGGTPPAVKTDAEALQAKYRSEEWIRRR